MVLKRRWRGLGVRDAYRWLGELEACCCSWGEGDADVGRRCSASWRLGEQERRERHPEELWRRLGEQERRKWALGAREARWRGGERKSRGRECLAGVERERCRLWERAPPRGQPAQSGGVGGALGAWCGPGG